MRGLREAEQNGASASSAASHKQWSLINSEGLRPTARSGHSAVVAGGSLYIFGGCGHPAEPPRCNEDGAEVFLGAADAIPICLGDLHLYDLARQRWSEVACNEHGGLVQPVERTCAAMCASEEEDRLFLSGGAGDDPRDFRADLLEFDVRQRTWRLLYDRHGGAAATATAAAPPFSKVCPCRRIGHSMVHDAARNQLVIFGGSADEEYFDDTHAFNLATKVWTVLTTTGDRPSPRYMHQAFIDADSMYVVGGGSFEPDGPDLDVYRLHLAGARSLQWERIRPIGTPPRCRVAHGLAWDRVGRAAYIWGGFTSGMELDCTFYALSLPPTPSTLPTPSFDIGASFSPILASNLRSAIPTGAGAVASATAAAGTVTIVSNAAETAGSTQPITVAAAAAARRKPRSSSVDNVDATPSLRVLAAGLGEETGVGTSGTIEPTDPREQQLQGGHQLSAQENSELRPRGAYGRDHWLRRGQFLWRQGSGDEGRASGPTATNSRPRGSSRRRPWGQGWTAGRLQGLWGGGSPSSAAAAPLSTATPALTVEGASVYEEAPMLLRPILSAAQRVSRGRPSKPAVNEELLWWVSLPSRWSQGDTSPSPARRSFHCLVFHGGSCYVTGGSDGDKKFGDMWRFCVRESPPPLTTLAARAFVSSLAAVGGDGGGPESPMKLPEGLPNELREALANLNMQAEVVL